jgi:hypothetical protein
MYVTTSDLSNQSQSFELVVILGCRLGITYPASPGALINVYRHNFENQTTYSCYSMREHTGVSVSSQQRVAHVFWAAHILAYLSKAGSHPQVQQHGDSSKNNDDEAHEDVDISDVDADTEVAAALNGTADSIQMKVLDCIAQLFSPAKGWNHVTATAVRQREILVEIDIARNDSFHTNSGNDDSRNPPEFALGTPEAELYAAMTRCLSTADRNSQYLIIS